MAAVWVGYRCYGSYLPYRLRTASRRRNGLEHLERKCKSETLKAKEKAKAKETVKAEIDADNWKKMDRKYNDFRDMSVWQKAFALLRNVYKIIRTFPPEEKYALTDDLRRSANSCVHNIAEGYGRFEPKDKTRFYKISRGSAYEAISQVLVAETEKYISTEFAEDIIMRYKDVIDELNSLIHSLEK